MKWQKAKKNSDNWSVISDQFDLGFQVSLMKLNIHTMLWFVSNDDWRLNPLALTCYSKLELTITIFQ